MSACRKVLGGLALAAVAVTGVRADMGSVWVEQVGKDSVTLKWSSPNGAGHRLVTPTGIPQYQVFCQAVPSIPTEGVPLLIPDPPVSGDERPIPVAGANEYTFTGLQPGRLYTFRVDGYAERQNAFSQWTSASYRQLGTVRQRTYSDPEGVNLRVVGTTKTSITVEFTNPRLVVYNLVRLAYKARWNMVGLDKTAAVLVDVPAGEDGTGGKESPATAWGESNIERGWVDIDHPVGTSIQAEFTSLSKTREYEFVAYGLNVHTATFERIASAGGRTAGYSYFGSFEAAMALNFKDVVAHYGREITAPEGSASVYTRVATLHPELDAARDLLREDQIDDLELDLTAILYLIDQRPADFKEWQESEATTLEAFVCSRYAEVCVGIPDDVEPAGPVFRRGDANADGRPDISDGMFILNYLFVGGRAPPCLDAADTNDKGPIDISDAIYLLAYLFNNGSSPPLPLGSCGVDLTPDALDCEEYFSCRVEE